MSEWGPWIEHDGSKQPVPPGTYIQAFFDVDCSKASDLRGWRYVSKHVLEGIVGKTDFSFRASYWPLRRYRIRKPKGLTILESILNDLPAPTKPTVPA